VGLKFSRPVDRSDASVIAASLLRPETFAAIFDRHFEAIHAYLARRAGAVAADDLASLTFTVAFERRSAFRAGADSARPWLFGIATNLLRNEWRSGRRELEAIARLHPRADDDGRLPAAHDGVDLMALLAGLDGDQRDVLLLFAWAELTYEEIASSLGIPVGTVRSRLARARVHVRSNMVQVAESGLPTPMVEETER
jgi:RNA polymerase sigma-70 factor (ECF subfamily)